jgi:WhiB family redox-sensing transcriptional regulator
MDWRNRAACRNDPDPNLWFPVGVSGPAVLQAAEAKTVCRRCPTMSVCLAYALDNNIEFGIYGGMTEQERAALKRRQTRTRQRAKTTTPKPAEETTPREPARVDGLLVAAPGTVVDRLYQEHTWGQRLHVVMVDGRSACGSLRLDAGRRLPAASLRAVHRCRRKACKDLFAVADREHLAVTHG